MKYLRKFSSVQEMNAAMADNWTGILGMVDDGTTKSIKNHEFVPQPGDEIWYTSTDGNIVTPNAVAFGDGITVSSNTYSGGKGIIKLSGNATTMGDNAFKSCKSLTSVTIPDSVTSIGDSAFNTCTGLTSVTIPDSVTSIGASAFRSCTGLTSLTCLATNPPTLANINALTSTNDCPIYVPAGSVDAYKAAANWSTYASRIQAIQS